MTITLPCWNLLFVIKLDSSFKISSLTHVIFYSTWHKLQQ